MSSTISNTFFVRISASFFIFCKRQISRGGVGSNNLMVPSALSKLYSFQVLKVGPECRCEFLT